MAWCLFISELKINKSCLSFEQNPSQSASQIELPNSTPKKNENQTSPFKPDSSLFNPTKAGSPTLPINSDISGGHRSKPSSNPVQNPNPAAGNPSDDLSQHSKHLPHEPALPSSWTLGRPFRNDSPSEQQSGSQATGSTQDSLSTAAKIGSSSPLSCGDFLSRSGRNFAARRKSAIDLSAWSVGVALGVCLGEILEIWPHTKRSVWPWPPRCASCEVDLFGNFGCLFSLFFWCEIAREVILTWNDSWDSFWTRERLLKDGKRTRLPAFWLDLKGFQGRWRRRTGDPDSVKKG